MSQEPGPVHRSLIEIVSAVINTGPTGAASEFLEGLGLEESEGRARWSRRLAVPVLSSRELDAVVAYRQDKWLTARRLAMLVLARRLHVDPAYVARKVSGTKAADAIQDNIHRYSI